MGVPTQSLGRRYYAQQRMFVPANTFEYERVPLSVECGLIKTDDVLPRNFSWLIQYKVAGSARPETESELEGVKKQGIKAIVSLTGTPLNPEIVARLGFEYLHAPISGAPTASQLSDIVQFIEEKNTESKPVLVHCGEGMGRTGTVLAAYLVRHGLGADDAIRRVRQLRPGSIQNPEQENAIREYEKTIRRV